jgi:hypothetical protein
LVAALQTRALDVLRAVGEAHLAATDAVLVSNQVDLPTAALARLWAFADLFLTAPTHHAREFHLQQELLIAPELEEGDASPAVIAAAMAVLELPRRLLAAAAGAGALDAPAEVRNTAGAPVDGSMARTFAWVAAMNGALLLDRLTVGPPMSGAALGREQTRSLLTGWGALPALLATAEGLAGGAAAERPARRKVRT